MFSIFWPFKILKALLGFILSSLIFAACALTAVSYFADKGFWWDLSSHFRMQYLFILVVGLVLSMISLRLEKKSRVEILLTFTFMAFFIGLNLVGIAPYYLSPKPQPAEFAAGRTVKLMHFNVLGPLNRQQKEVASAIRSAKPDMVDLVEYTPDWQHKLEATGVFKNYPYRIAGQSNIALYSKLPVQGRVVFTPGKRPVTENANIVARFQLNGQPVTLMVAHPLSPFLPGRLKEQRLSFHAWGKQRKQLGENLVIIGDLNTTPWSAEFQNLISVTQLRDSQLGFGIQPSWPTFFIPIAMGHTTKAQQNHLLQPLAIPIDHVLVSPEILVLSRTVGPFVGSDHLPVIAEIGMKKR